MSKSQGNAVLLSASDADIEAAVQRLYTDPNHLRASDPGQGEGNVVFTYLDAFDPDSEAVAHLKAEYRRGGLGDIVLKRRLTASTNAILSYQAFPIGRCNGMVPDRRLHNEELAGLGTIVKDHSHDRAW